MFRVALAALLLSGPVSAQNADALAPQVRKYLAVAAPKVILAHVEVIDGTGAPPRPDQNVTIAGGKIAAIEPGADRPASQGITVLDLRGRSIIPGIVGMHDHLFYLARPNLAADGTFEAPFFFVEQRFSAPRLYLANGVTTIRTTGAIEPDTDLKLQRDIDGGTVPGPHLEVTGPYLDGLDDARKTVAYWADRGVTSFKAYKNIKRKDLKAAIDEAHKRRLKVTGHLCSVTYPEAIELGIDNLEHGFFVNTALDPDKKPDVCSSSSGDFTLEHIGSADAGRLIAALVKRRVAITSTLVGLGQTVLRVDPPPALLEAMSPTLRAIYPSWRSRPPAPNAAVLLRKEMELERAFVAAGGLLIAGPDPVGIGTNIPGFGDHREIELLVEAGFTPVEAIRIATSNGATFLGRQDRIGTIAVGKNADLVVVNGDPAARIADVENVELVFKDGAGYDPKKLLDSVKGRYGEY
ncbi:MAG: amidohydrolase family protein [Myxococcales bacterium]|nr:amidohydrolase family protein [Myxococcales bacterium]